MEIVNYKINLKEDCPEQVKKALDEYWSKQTFNVPFNQIAKKYKIDQKELRKLIRAYSSMSFDVICSFCDKHYSQEFKSRSSFNNFMSFRNGDEYKCETCAEDMIAKRKKENEKLRMEELNDRKEWMRKAVKNSEWLNISEDSYVLLKIALKYKKKEESYREMETIGYDNLVIDKCFKELQERGLFYFVSYFNKSYTEIRFDPELEAKMKLNQRKVYKNSNFGLKENNKINIETKSSKHVRVNYNHEINELKFMLTNNEIKPQNSNVDYGGYFVLKEDVVLKANTQYSFGGWHREKGSIYVSIVPTESIYNMVSQGRFSSHTKEDSDQIQGYFSDSFENDD